MAFFYRLLSFAAGLATFVLAVQTALAADTVINFDPPAAPALWTRLSTEYQSDGVVFGGGPTGDVYRTATEANWYSPVAHSGTQFAVIEQSMCSGEIRVNDAWARFVAPRQHVQVYVRELTSANPYTVTLEGWGVQADPLHGTPLVSSTASVGNSGWTLASISRPGQDIAFLHIYAPPGVAYCTAIDDLTFDQSGTNVPDFGLSFLGQGIAVGPSNMTAGTAILTRFGGSTGDINLSVGGLPAGVTSVISPNIVPGNTVTNGVTITLIAAPDAPAVTGAQVTLTGLAAVPSAGNTGTPHTIIIPVNVTTPYTVVAKSIEVTQGIASAVALPARNFNDSSLGTLSRSLPYTTATQLNGTTALPLAAGRKTIARVFAEVVNATSAPNVFATLNGFDANMNPLPGSPLTAENQPQIVFSAPTGYVDTVSWQQRTNQVGTPFEFTLPPSWTTGKITLQALLVPIGAETFDLPTAAPCNTQDCLNLQQVAISGVPFTPMTPLTIATVTVNLTGYLPGPPSIVFGAALKVMPAVLNVTDYLGDIEAMDINNSGDSRSDQASSVLDRIEDWDEDNNEPGAMIIGVSLGGADLGKENGDQVYGSGRPKAVVNQARPLTSVAHELGHGLGLHHASFSCGAADVDANGDAVQWPPDQRGHLEGVGIDVDSAAPRTIIAAPAPPDQPENPEWDDFMSYCASAPNVGNTGPQIGLGGVWISAPNWLNVMFTGAGPNPIVAIRPMASTKPTSPNQPSLEIAATVGDKGARITRVRSSFGLLNGAAASPYRVRVFDQAGKLLTDTPMVVKTAHVDPSSSSPAGGSAAASSGGVKAVALSARVAVSGARKIVIVQEGKSVAERSRGDHPPAVTLTEPKAGSTIGLGETTLAAWTITNPDKRSLLVKLDYSADGGAHWRTIYSGPDRGSVDLRNGLVPHSANRQGRLRIRVSDGFNEASSVSGALTAAGSPPSVSILSPHSGQTILADTTLSLHGRATDDGHLLLGAGQLVWYLGDRQIGQGDQASVTGLSPGKSLITLRARDSLGRIGTATVTVNVVAAKPLFLTFKQPASVGVCDKEALLGIAASVPGLLEINERSYPVGRTPQTINVPIAPGTSPVTFLARLAAFDKTNTRAVLIPRAKSGGLILCHVPPLVIAPQ